MKHLFFLFALFLCSTLSAQEENVKCQLPSLNQGPNTVYCNWYDFTDSIASGKYPRAIPDIGTIYRIYSRASSVPSRTLNTSFQPSTAKDVFAFYSTQIACTISLTGGQTGTIFLETSPNNSTWTEIGRAANTNSGALTIGLNLTNTNTGQVGGYIPKGYYVRLRSTGTCTSTLIGGQETLF